MFYSKQQSITLLLLNYYTKGKNRSSQSFLIFMTDCRQHFLLPPAKVALRFLQTPSDWEGSNYPSFLPYIFTTLAKQQIETK